MKQKYTLIIIFLAFVVNGFSQNNYQVTAIPFQQFTGNAIPLTSADDVYSPAINLPFNFEFYGNTYDQIVVSTNGFINFNNTNAGGFTPWSFSQTIPSTSFPALNSILGCFHDMNNASAAGTITPGVYGTAPYRKFVVYFNTRRYPHCQQRRRCLYLALRTSNINRHLQVQSTVTNIFNCEFLCSPPVHLYAFFI